MNRDFSDLLAEFNAHGVEYLVVGSHALAAHGLVRATKDLDVWVRPSKKNAERVLEALQSFGAPLLDLTVEDLTSPELIFQIGLPPLRIDVITSIEAVTFEEAWEGRLKTSFGDQRVGVLSRDHLIVNKSATGREQDMVDAKWLKEHTGPAG